MKVSVYNWEGKVIDEMEISQDVFGAPVRTDIMTRVVLWQLAKRRSGNHKTKEIGDVSGTTRKPHKQKGTGRARQGSLRSPQFRKGAVIFGPVVRDHGYGLPKKVRRLGLKSALSCKFLDNKAIILDSLSFESVKTRDMKNHFSEKSLLIGGDDICNNLQRATSNLHHVNILPRHAANVYDILRHERLILSRDALAYLDTWLSA